MTEDEMKEQLQSAQDMLDTITQQRDAANNAVVQLNARVKQLERKLAAATKAPEAPPPAPTLNGHDAEAAALN